MPTTHHTLSAPARLSAHAEVAPNARPPLLWWEWPLLGLALASFLAQLWWAAPQKSAAFDEQYHLVSGYSYLRTGDFRLATNHPPLMGLVAALGVWNRADLVLPLDHPAWQAGDRFLFSDVFLWEANPDPQAILVAARRPIMLVGLLLLVVLFAWARQLQGRWASWLVLGLATFDPNLLGNARVVTTDLGLTCLLGLATWRLWCWLEQRTWPNLILAGIGAGLAMGVKYTGLFFWPSALLVLLLYPATTKEDTRWQRACGLAGMGLTALGVIWALFRFDFGPMPAGPIPWPLPAPFYWQQLYNTFFRIVDLQGARYDFFWGEAANHGWWSYFPVAIGVKTPLPVLILASMGLVTALRQWGWRRTSILLSLPLLFLLLGLTGVLTIGYRHILPIVPFLLLLAGLTTNLPRPNLHAVNGTIHNSQFAIHNSPFTIHNLLLAVLLIWAALGSLRLYPHEESFFNELAGDWYNWSNLLVDSNLDWGQDLPALRQVMAEQGISEVNLAYFGKAVPEQYGVRYRPLPGYLRFVEGTELNAYNPYQPEPGWYAISATSLRLGLHQAESIELYRWFRDQRPVARAGYSIYLYHVTDPANLPVIPKVVVGQPAYLVAAPDLGIQPAQRVQIKWLQTPDVQFFPAGASFVPLALYQPVQANFSDHFTLLGYTLPSAVRPGASVTLTLYWQVGTQPLPQPAPTRGNALAAFVHLTAPDDPGQKIAQFDGWPTAVRGLEPGDVIAQPVTLDLSPEATAGRYALLVGLYSPQSLARLPVTEPPGQADFMRAGEIEVQ